ncbi:hypothetical protein J2X65_004257 [Ancylobacter sp. 3268]|uniref:hypothetical protein n=1 Tax=Ancylobacter sp. 3268 TaxID=2817752 RepID=UPI0028541E94|nr:hypothetical protein [Ancylobacter sp. 3268]MDR6954881.1 hypothetical protein [Ancylobacter sp. 3268]
MVIVPRAVAYGLVRAAVKGGLVHSTVFDAIEAGVILAAEMQLLELSDEEKSAWAARVHELNGGLPTPTRGLPQ